MMIWDGQRQAASSNSSKLCSKVLTKTQATSIGQRQSRLIQQNGQTPKNSRGERAPERIKCILAHRGQGDAKTSRAEEIQSDKRGDTCREWEQQIKDRRFINGKTQRQITGRRDGGGPGPRTTELMRMQDEVCMRRDTTDNNEEEGRGEVQCIPTGAAADIRPNKPTWGMITEAHRGRTKKETRTCLDINYLGRQQSEAYYTNITSKTTGRFREKGMVPGR